MKYEVSLYIGRTVVVIAAAVVELRLQSRGQIWIWWNGHRWMCLWRFHMAMEWLAAVISSRQGSCYCDTV